MNDFLINNEAIIRLGFFFGTFACIAVWEIIAPRRALTVSKGIRWANNLALVFFNSFLLRLLLPTITIGTTVLAAQHGWGLFNFVEVNFYLAVFISVVVLDMIIYFQHVMFHAVPLFWRLHRVHHTDLDYDVTTGLRFHPIEIFLSIFIKLMIIVLLGPPVVAVIIFEVVLNASAMFNHGNIRLPSGVDRVLRRIIVTPDMHRVHHSIEEDETNSNFGFNLSLWDRLFGTYRAQPRAGHDNMTIGISTFRDVKVCSWLPRMLAIPFMSKTSGYAINRQSEKTDR